MPISWLSWKKSLACKSEPGEVHDPQKTGDFNTFTIFDTRKLSGCSRSIANLKDVIHSSRRVVENSSAGSPLSVQSCDIFPSISHEAVLRNRDFNKESQIYSCVSKPRSNLGATAPPHAHLRGTPLKRFGSCYDCKCAQNPAVCSLVYRNVGSQNTPSPAAAASLLSLEPVCQRCGEIFYRYEALENHHLAKHAVTQLRDGDSSRNIVEIIFRTSWLKPGMSNLAIERILKVHNMPKTIARFEDYRDMVKTRANKLTKKHPRCLADGNELLRFYGTSVVCSLGMNGSSSACGLASCNVCRIIRMGFSPTKKESGGKGIVTTATSGKADDSISMGGETGMATLGTTKRAMLVCRVIAGRIHKSYNNTATTAAAAAATNNNSTTSLETAPSLLPSGFDSMAGTVALYSNVEELYVINSKAILPCFVVIYTC